MFWEYVSISASYCCDINDILLGYVSNWFVNFVYFSTAVGCFLFYFLVALRQLLFDFFLRW